MAQLSQSRGKKVFVAGESLGTGIACHLAGKYPEQISSILLVTPFPELADIGRHHFPLIPIGLLLRDRYDNKSNLATYAGPVAFVIAARDEIVPSSLGQRLHDEYTGPKKLFTQPLSGHNDLDYSPENKIWREVAEFMLRSKPHPAAPPMNRRLTVKKLNQ